MGGHHMPFLDFGGDQKTRTGAAGRGNALLLDFGGMQQARSWAMGQQEVYAGGPVLRHMKEVLQSTGKQ